MMDIPRLDVEQRIGNTFAYRFAFRQTDGQLRQFTGSTAVFHAQSGAGTLHFESGTDPEVTIVDVPDSSKGPGATNAGILVQLPYSLTETWVDEQKWFYEVEEWTGPGRYTLIDGVITATLGVVDSAD
jgi:hypothetical protein